MVIINALSSQWYNMIMKNRIKYINHSDKFPSISITKSIRNQNTKWVNNS
jgi:hypothetical protein